MQYFGEIISMVVAVSWTVTAVLAEIASKRLGASELNVLRMIFSMFMLAITLYFYTGYAMPQYMPAEGWLWLSLSGFMGYAFGDYCLFNSYLIIGSRFGQLFMTLASPFAALSSFLLLGERMGTFAILGMLLTITGIGMSILNRGAAEEGQKKKFTLKLPLKGVLLGLGAGLGQGVGLVLSKMGMNSYESALAALSPDVDHLQEIIQAVPFSSTMVRAITGLVCFSAVLFIQGKAQHFREGLHDRKGMIVAFVMTIFGPFVGVSLSLMAVQYTAAGIAQTIMATTPILIMAPSYFLFHQKITWKEILGAIISIIGVSLFFV